MKRFGRILRNIGLGLLVLIVVLAAAGVWFVRRPWPQTNGQITAAGLSAPVQVIRDTWGVPHIYAQNDHDLFFGQGYVHAQDRLWQMEFSRRVGMGTLSEVFGKQTINNDIVVRTMGWNRSAQRDWEAMDADSRAILEAYSAGVNEYINTHRNRLPLQFTILGVDPAPWRPVDTLAWGKTFTYSLSGNYRLELLRAQLIAAVGAEKTEELLPPYGADKPLIIPPEAQGYATFKDARFAGLDSFDTIMGEPGPIWGSNNLVVHGSRTATGKPMLANDTHLNLSIPALWYEVGLHGGRFNSVGFSLSGIPGVILGHNDRIAWGASNVNPDIEDLYLEKLNDPDHPTQYEFQGQWHDLQTLTETIAIKGQAPQTLTVYSTNHGPIVSDALTATPGLTGPFSIRWTALEGSTQFPAIIQLDLATNWDQFRHALSLWDVPSQNFVYADVDGNIGYQTPGRIPIRPAGDQGLVPVPGWTGEHEWQGFIPFEQLPHTFNPPQGFITTANNKIVGDDYPYLLAYEWDVGYRAKRMTDLLAADSSITEEDIEAIQGDTYSLAAEAVAPYLTQLQSEDALEAQAIGLVRNWDKRLEIDRTGASVYQAWYWFLLKDTVSDDLGTEASTKYLTGQYERHGTFQVPFMLKLLAEPNNLWFDDSTTPQVETRDDIEHRSLTEAIAWLSERYGKDPNQWTWGRLHTMTFEESSVGSSGIAPLEWIFNARPIPARGDNFTVDAGSFRYSDPFVMVHGVSERDIIDLGDFGNSISIIPTGESELPFHPHHADLIQLWEDIKYHPMFFDQARIEQNAEGTLTLTPP